MAIQMQRHGSRYPLGSELSPFITGLVSKLANASSVLSSSKAIRSLPSQFQFLTKGYKSSLGVNDLTAPGRLELFNAGVECVTLVENNNNNTSIRPFHLC